MEGAVGTWDADGGGVQEGGVVGEGGVVFGEAEEGGEFVEFDGFFAVGEIEL